MSNLPLRQPLPESGDGRISFRPPTPAEEARTIEQTRQLRLDNDDRELGHFLRDFWPRCGHFFVGMIVGVIGTVIAIRYIEMDLWLGVGIGVLSMIAINSICKWKKARPKLYKRMCGLLLKKMKHNILGMKG